MTREKESEALSEIAAALCRLGNGNASTDMGAIEAHGLAIKEAAHEIADALWGLADAIRESS